MKHILFYGGCGHFTYWQMLPFFAHADTVELTVLILVWVFVYNHTLCLQAAKAPVSLHIYTGLPEPSFLFFSNIV